MQITSPAFQDTEQIPERYTCDTEDFLSPPLAITEVPEATQSLVLIMDDPDVPKVLGGKVFIHWILFNIPPTTSRIPEGAEIGTPGLNTLGEARYASPCPPRGYEPKTHRYFFKLYALDTTLDLADGALREEVVAALRGHVLAAAELIGTYSRG